MQSNTQSQTQHRPRSTRSTFYRYDTNSFWMRWLGSALFVWPMSVVVTVIVFVPLAILVGAFEVAFIDNTMEDLVMSAIVFVLAGGAIGFSIGVLQRYVLRNVLYWTADYWRVSSTIGGIIGAIVLGLLMLITDQYLLEDTLFTLAAMPIFATILGVAQMFALRVAVSHSWLWVLANLVGGLVFAGLSMRNSLDPRAWGELIGTLGLGILGAMAQGIVTGYILLFLFERMAYPFISEDKPNAPEKISPQPVTSKPESVWDEAV
ncbi:MAG: hypothetical protein KC615_14520 [Anaerolineae bacterium]|nr:hypothetical protein [Anaerolineae bacterium]MCA9894200.1 hypothetical protein [Anaerolineae bacterium]MCB9458043.1 hypothetical protein [Anaerolineaceae bacterium]